MKTLRSVLADTWREARGSRVLLGERDLVLPPLSRQQAKRLEEGLQRAIRQNNRLFWTLVGVTVGLILALATAVFVLADRPGVLQLLGALIGASASGLVLFLARLWREKTALEMLAILVPTVQGEALSRFVVELLARMRSWSIKEHELTAPRPTVTSTLEGS